ncbi:MAG: hypothetical protein HOG49_21360 [Candidatus Scalindua sp.]|nr:hypothetical protein [Candidatus Scalindua sp.]
MSRFITIIKDRLGGQFAEGLYSAWLGIDPPKEVKSELIHINSFFWANSHTRFFGYGNTEKTCVENLIHRMRRNNKNKETFGRTQLSDFVCIFMDYDSPVGDRIIQVGGDKQIELWGLKPCDRGFLK